LSRPEMRLAGRHPVGLSLAALTAAAQPANPFRRPTVNREAELLGDRRQRVAIGGMEPLSAAVQRKPGRLDCVDAAAHPAPHPPRPERPPPPQPRPPPPTPAAPAPITATSTSDRNAAMQSSFRSLEKDYRAATFCCGDASAISLTSLLVIASAKEWKSSTTRK